MADNEAKIGEERATDPAERPPEVARITVVESIYHESGTSFQDPSCMENRFERLHLSGSEQQVYVRHSTIGPDTAWRRLDTGWIEPSDLGLLVIRNRQGVFQTIPTAEEREREMGLSVAVASTAVDSVPKHNDGWIVYPTEHFRGTPGPGNQIWIRAIVPGIKVRYTVWAFPK